MSDRSGPTLIAAAQMVSGPEVADNLPEAERLIAAAAVQGARLVALPEYFPMIGAGDAARLAAGEEDDELGGEPGPIQKFLRDTAKKYGIWLVGGSLPLAADDPAKVRNTCFVYDDRGRRVARYDKIHLFDFARGTERYQESLTIEPGRKVVAFDSPFGRIGLAICYDLRFPELFRELGEVDLLVIPSAFTVTTGKAHWEVLLRARAVENQCYVLAAAQGGRHPNGRLTYGHSMIVDPWGEIQARLDEGSGVAVAEFDPERIDEVRASLPALTHRVII